MKDIIKKLNFNRKQLIILAVIGLSCLAVILGFVYSYYTDGDGSLFGSNNSSAGTGMTGIEVADPTPESLTDYVSPDILQEWTDEAEDTLEEYVEEDESDSEEADSSNSGSSSSNNSNSNSSSNNSSSNSTTTTPSETLGKGEWLAKYYDGGVLRYYGDGSVFDMTRNVWWTKTQWYDFMEAITQ